MNTPKYRQAWILEELKKSPLLSFAEMWRKYGRKWQKSERTFARDWELAQKQLKNYQKTINDKVIEETTQTEIEERKKGVLNKIQALEILSKISKGEAVKVDGKIILPTYKDRISAITQLSKMEGWDAPTKHDHTTQGEKMNNTPLSVQVEIISPPEE